MSAPYDATRYAPLQVSLLQHLPQSNARTFMIAAALGRIVGEHGSERLGSGRQATGSVIRPDRLPAVLEAADMSPRQWRAHVADWIARYAAHRCRKGVVCLFTRPQMASCPACGAALPLAERLPPPVKKRRGPGFATGETIAARTASQSPDRGASVAKAAAHYSPVLERESTAPSGRFLLGLEVGEAVLEGPEALPEEIEQQLEKTRRRSS
jgi:hypothetical protein